MRRGLGVLVGLVALLGCRGREPGTHAEASARLLPDTIAGFHAAPAARYDGRTVFDYLDGGAEVYLAFGMRRLTARRYLRAGEPAITADVFEMVTAAGAYGIFAFERESETAGVGEGSEYGGGLLRFWQGRTFGALLSERETPATRETLFALARHIAADVPAAGGPPPFVGVLPPDRLTPTTVRWLPASALLDHQLHPSVRGPFSAGPARLGLGAATEIVIGRYDAPVDRTRVVVGRLPDAGAARAAVAALGAAVPPLPGTAPPVWEAGSRFTLALAEGAAVVLVLDAPSRARAETLARSIGARLGRAAGAPRP